MFTLEEHTKKKFRAGNSLIDYTVMLQYEVKDIFRTAMMLDSTFELIFLTLQIHINIDETDSEFITFQMLNYKLHSFLYFEENKNRRRFISVHGKKRMEKKKKLHTKTVVK